jgi:hypothetical protein
MLMVRLGTRYISECFSEEGMPTFVVLHSHCPNRRPPVFASYIRAMFVLSSDISMILKGTPTCRKIYMSNQKDQETCPDISEKVIFMWSDSKAE